MSSKSAPIEGLLDELQATLTHGSVAHRVETLRRVTDLFLSGDWPASTAHRAGPFARWHSTTRSRWRVRSCRNPSASMTRR
jgi:hypothetical protein